jgi:hypothetical protein
MSASTPQAAPTTRLLYQQGTGRSQGTSAYGARRSCRSIERRALLTAKSTLSSTDRPSERNMIRWREYGLGFLLSIVDH